VRVHGSSWVAAIAAALTIPAAVAQEAAPAASSDPARVDAGKRLYVSYCARCHGLNMAVTGAAFFDLRTFPKDDKPRFVESVTRGKREMPAWGAILKTPEIDLLWAYVSSGSR
jgi:mono/diheme cytochrome c family protein